MDIKENISEEIITGYKFKKQYTDDEGNKKYKNVSFWTKAVDIEFDDNKNLEEKLGNIKGITTDFDVKSIGYAADMTALAQLKLEYISLIQYINNKYSELNTKVDNAISGGSLAPPYTLNLLQTPYTVYQVGADYNGSWHYPIDTSNSGNGFSWVCPESREGYSMAYGRTYNPVTIKGTSSKPYILKANISFSAPYNKEPLGTMSLQFLENNTVVHTINSSRSGNYAASIVTNLNMSSWNNKNIALRIYTGMSGGDYAQCVCSINTLTITNT